jgi:hypothetical protein
VIDGILLCIQQWRPGVYIGLPTCMYVICCLYLSGTDVFTVLLKPMVPPQVRSCPTEMS